MATGVSGNFEIAGNNGIAMRIYYSESYEVSTNVSTVSITDIQIKSSDWYGITYYLNGSITIDGSAVVSMDSDTGTHSVSISAKNTYVSVSGSKGAASIAHNTDGSKSIAISVSVRGYTQSGGAGSGWTVAGSKSVALTTIPRASTIGATNADIESVSTITIGKKNLNYTHSIAYHFGDIHGFVTADGGTSPAMVAFGNSSVPFRVPDTFYSQIPDDVSGVCTLVCTTYSGTSKIGSSTQTHFTVRASPRISSPIVSGTVVDSNDATKALTGDATRLVRYCSTALCTINATARNSASIVRKLINGEQVSGDTRSIWGVETGDFTFYAQDSRGYSGEANIHCEIVPYVVLTNNASVYRPSPTTGEAVINIKGNYFNASFGAVQNTLEVKYRIRGGNWVATTPKISESSFTASVRLEGMDYNESFDIEVSVSDKIGSIIQQIILGKGIPVFDWGENDFTFNVPVTLGTAKTVSSPDDAIQCGFYRTPLPSELGSSGYMSGYVVRNEPNWITQFWWYSKYYFRRDMRNGVWQPWEWENPPMTLGKEYRTTERFNGKPVYTQAFSATMTNGKHASYPKNPEKYVIRGSAFLSDGTAVPNMVHSPSSSYFNNVCFAKKEMWMYCGTQHAGKTVYAQIWYIKDSP